MAKKIVIEQKPNKKSTNIIDQWVESGAINEANNANNDKSKKEKKITISVSEKLHKKIKLYCTHNDIKIKDQIIEILEKEFQ